MLATLTALITRSTATNTLSAQSSRNSKAVNSQSASMSTIVTGSAQPTNEQLHHNQAIRNVRNTQREYFLTQRTFMR